jgi:ATP-dependent protease ClpP protease subunit
VTCAGAAPFDSKLLELPTVIKVEARGKDTADVLIHEQIGGDWLGDGLTSKRFAEDMAKLEGVRVINLRINSPGGSVTDGLGIYNTLAQHPARINVIVEGLAASMASVLAMVGDSITMGEGALMMIHSPRMLAMGTAEDLRKSVDLLDKFEGSLLDIYVKRTGLARADIKAMLAEETWFNGAEAVEQGFADEAASSDEGTAALARTENRERFTAFATAFRQHVADLNPLRIAAVLKSDLPDAIEVTQVTDKATASVQAADIENAARTAAAAAIAAESDRRRKIKDSFGSFAEAHRELLDASMDDVTCTVDAARAKLLEAVGKDAKPIGGQILITRDARDNFLTGAEKGILAKLGLEKREAGNEFSGMSLPDIAAHTLAQVGISVRGLSRDKIASRVFATHSTSDFPQLMSNVAGKVLRKSYENYPDTWRKWALAGSVSDFKIHPRIQTGSLNNLATIPEGGEYTFGTLAEQYENAQAATKGKAIALTRQMIVNDDLGAFNRRAQLMGRAAARTVNVDAYTYLSSGSSNLGPTSADTGQYFNATASTTAAGHANYTGTGTAISTTSIALARKTMRVQKDAGNLETLNILPKILLTCSGKEDIAWAVLNSTTDVSQSNPAKKNFAADVARLELVTDPFLDGVTTAGTTRWYLMADPADIAAFEVVFLDGNETPFVDEQVEFMNDAMMFKVRLDYGVAIGDWRAAYLNAGA